MALDYVIYTLHTPALNARFYSRCLKTKSPEAREESTPNNHADSLDTAIAAAKQAPIDTKLATDINPMPLMP